MTKKSDTIKFIIFAVTYILACMTFSSNNIGGYFSYGSTERLILKFAMAFIFVLTAVLINKNQQEKAVKFTSIALNVILLLFIFDYNVTKISGSSPFAMMWLSTIYMANAGYYVGLSLGRKGDFGSISKKFWLSFLPTYAYTFALVFIRKPNTYYEVNLKLGSGLISYLKYSIEYFHTDFTIIFNYVGNIVFFIPLPFLINTVFSKLKNYQKIIIGVLIPFIIEGYQYIFKCGSVDIDDIVFNLLGMLIGLICLMLEKRFHNDKKLKQD